MLTGVYETLRSAGRDLKLELGEHAGVAERLAELQAAARELAADDRRRPRSSSPPRTPRSRSATNPEQLLDLVASRRAGDRAAEFRGARDRLAAGGARGARGARQGAAAGAARPVRRRVRRREAARVGARLRGPAAPRARPAARRRRRCASAEQLRFRAIMVDEFQDTNRLQCDIVDLLRSGTARRTSSSSATSSSRSTASATPTSPSSASAASAPRSGCR